MSAEEDTCRCCEKAHKVENRIAAKCDVANQINFSAKSAVAASHSAPRFLDHVRVNAKLLVLFWGFINLAHPGLSCQATMDSLNFFALTLMAED